MSEFIRVILMNAIMVSFDIYWTEFTSTTFGLYLYR